LLCPDKIWSYYIISIGKVKAAAGKYLSAKMNCGSAENIL